MVNNKKCIRRASWDKGASLTGPKSSVTVEDTLAQDWEVFEYKLSDLKPGDKFTLWGNTYIKLHSAHLTGTNINNKNVYFDNTNYDLCYTKDDLVVEKLS